MRVSLLAEPELEFGGGGRHIDTRFGLTQFGPVDLEDEDTRRIPMAVIGSSRSIEAFSGWFERIDKGVEGKDSTKRNFYPRFPGVGGSEGAFRCKFGFDSSREAQLAGRRLRRLEATAPADVGKATNEMVEMVMEELTSFSEKRIQPKVTVVAMPVEAYGLRALGGGRVQDATVPYIHDVLKARAMSLGMPIQVVWPQTVDPSQAPKAAPGASRRRVQDEATRAWNLCTGLYYKGGGTPWRLTSTRAEYASLCVGIRFFQPSGTEELHSSLAQVFDERGDGTIVRGSNAYIDKQDRQPHLDEASAEGLLRSALQAYRREHRTMPARIVVHKSSRFTDKETSGFFSAAEDANVDIVNLVWIGSSPVSLYREGRFPPLRGTFVTMDSGNHILYTRGTVPFYQMYPGMYVPRPIGIVCQDIDGAPREIAEEILALTKMNWNNTQFDGRTPITLRAARGVSEVLRHLRPGDQVRPQYRYYM